MVCTSHVFSLIFLPLSLHKIGWKRQTWQYFNKRDTLKLEPWSMSLKNVCSRPPTSFPIPTWESYKVLTHSLWIHHCIYAIPLYQPLRLLSVSPVLLLQGDELAVGLTRAHQSLCQSLRGDQSCRTQPVPFAMWFSHKTERLHLCYTLCLSVCRWIGAAEMEALKMFYLYGIVSFCCSVYGGGSKKKKSESKVQVMYDDDDVCMYLDTAFPSVTGQL